MIKKFCFCLAFVATLFFGEASYAVSFPKLTGQVVDAAHILTPETVNQIHQILPASEQIVVVTVPSLEGLSIEEYGYQLGRYWGIGDKDKDDGVLLLVAPNERLVRIEVGYGRESILTDAFSSMIIQNMIIPEFKKGDMNAGILKGVDGILSVLNSKKSISLKNGKVVSSASGLINNLKIEESPFEPFLFFGFFIVMGILIYYANKINPSKTDSSEKKSRRNRFKDDDFWNNHGSHGGGSFGGGGFHGGGGNFGGGGASGKW